MKRLHLAGVNFVKDLFLADGRKIFYDVLRSKY